MKNLTIRLLSVVMAAMLFCLPVVAEEADAFTSASVNDSYTEYALTGEELVNAINSFSGFYQIVTTNPDGTANSGFFIYGALEHEGQLYLRVAFGPNQTKLNMEKNGCGVAIYAAAPTEKPYAMAGARMTFEVVTDTALFEALEMDPAGPFFLLKVTEVKSLG